MSMRSIIARATPDGFAGRYVHHNGQPTARVPLLLTLYQDSFGRDLEAMQQFLLDRHPAGWSCLGPQCHGDIGFTEPGSAPLTPGAPQCYCHGDRREEPQLLTHHDADPLWHWWVYLMTPQGLEVRAADPRGTGWLTPVHIPWTTHPGDPLPTALRHH
jgi:hypothetical protein